jgi:pseudouridine-5'-phosphate glycosidase
MTHYNERLFSISTEVNSALKNKQPVVALETAVVTHGLPYPENVNLASGVENEIRSQGAVPATVAVMHGKVHVGLTAADLEELGNGKLPTRKISRRDYAIALTHNELGGTTVCGTLIAASNVGIKVFSTGGIGGIHRGAPFDVSADLPELSRSPLVVVCAGAKSILDLPATVEYLETMGVPVVGYQTKQFPAFYSQESGLPVTETVQHPQEIAEIARAHWEMGLQSAVLVVTPPPAEAAMPRDEVEKVIEKAVREAESKHIAGAAVTPFLLSKVSELTGGKSMRANLALLHNNARLAARIACELSKPKFLQA